MMASDLCSESARLGLSTLGCCTYNNTPSIWASLTKEELLQQLNSCTLWDVLVVEVGKLQLITCHPLCFSSSKQHVLTKGMQC